LVWVVFGGTIATQTLFHAIYFPLRGTDLSRLIRTERSELPIEHPVDRKTIIICDFDMGGFKPPEMVKRRPSVVIVGRLPNRSKLATLVPLSGTPAPPNCDYQCAITLTERLPPPFDGQLEWWVKADMLATVSFARLDLLRTGRGQDGRRTYLKPKVTETQFDQIRATILRALRFKS
jgi:uncharacterized protein YifN (PemK superfamily)